MNRLVLVSAILAGISAAMGVWALSLGSDWGGWLSAAAGWINSANLALHLGKARNALHNMRAFRGAEP